MALASKRMNKKLQQYAKPSAKATGEIQVPPEDPHLKDIKKSLDIPKDPRFVELEHWEKKPAPRIRSIARDRKRWTLRGLGEDSDAESIPDPVGCKPEELWGLVPEPIEAPPPLDAASPTAGMASPLSPNFASPAAAATLLPGAVGEDGTDASAFAPVPATSSSGPSAGAAANKASAMADTFDVSNELRFGDLKNAPLAFREVSMMFKREDANKVMDIAAAVSPSPDIGGVDGKIVQKFGARTHWEESLTAEVRHLMVDFKLSNDPKCRLNHLDRVHDWFSREGRKKARQLNQPPSKHFLTFEKYQAPHPGSLRGGVSASTPAEATVGLAVSWRVPYASRLEKSFNIVPGPPPPGPGYK